MELLNPRALWLLLLVPLIVLAYRRRPPAERRNVSNLYLWRASAPPAGISPVRRLRENPLLWLQILCLLSMILGLTRPALRTGEHQMVLVFDVSASMGARDGRGSRLDSARARARDVLRTQPPSSVRVMTATKTLLDLGRFANKGDPELAATLANIDVSAGSTDLTAQIDTLRRGVGSGARIHVFT